MSTEEQRQAFLDAIKANPLDEANRKVFADWLDEHDEPEEADFYRAWTAEKYHEAWDWLSSFASRTDLTTGELVDAARNYVENGTYFVERDSSWVRDEFYGNEELFWQHWQIVAGVRLSDGEASANPFSCSC